MSDSHDEVSIEELLQLAPQLQALAGHLAREWDQREDLVQDTWARVLSRPPRERTNLSSWLRSALRMQRADTVRHQNAARRKQQALPESDPTPRPDELVERAEAHEAVVRALRKLEEPYRSVLLLHYFESLSVDEIARRLKTPRGTVATHLRRGRERLRAELVSKHGDDAHRICKMAAGPAIGAATGALTLSPPLLPLGMLAAGLIALAVVVWPDANDGALDRDATTFSANIEDSQHNSAGGAGIPTREDEDGRTQLSTENDSPFETVTITGRCIDAETQLPVAGAQISLKASLVRNEQAIYAPEVKPNIQSPVRTAADGSFELDFENSEFYEYTILITGSNHAQRNAYWSVGWGRSIISSENQIELGTIELEPGYPLSGRVVDENGSPVPRTQLSLKDLPFRLTQFRSGRNSITATSDENGHFHMPALIPSGTWNVSVNDWRGYGTEELLSATVGKDQDHSDWKIVVHKLEAISGHIYDLAGRPIHGALIDGDSSAPDGDVPYLASWTNSDGRFVIHKRKSNLGPVRLSLDSGVTEEWTSDGLVEWGNHEYEIRVKRARAFRVRVVDRSTQQPLSDYRLKAVPTNSSGSSSRNFRDTQVDSLGESDLEWAPTGEFWLSAFPLDRQHWVRSPMKVAADQKPVDGEILTLYSEILPATEIELVGPGQSPLPNTEFSVYDLDAKSSGRPPILTKGVTNQEGRATIHVPSDIALEIEVVPGQSRRRKIPFDPVLGQLNQVEIALGTRVELSLSQKSQWEGLELRFMLSNLTGGESSHQFALDPASNTFSGSLPAGHYTLDLVHRSRSDQNSRKVAYGFAQVAVPDTELFKETLDITAYEPSRIEGQVWLGSTPAREGEVSVSVLVGDLNDQNRIGTPLFRSSRVRVGETGNFAFDAIPPGPARIHFHPNARQEKNEFREPTASTPCQVVVTPASEHVIQVDIATESARFLLGNRRVIDAPWTIYRDGTSLGHFYSGFGSELALIGFGPGSYEVEIRGKRYGPFIVEAGQEWSDFTIQLRDD